MATVTTTYRVSAGARDGRQTYSQRTTGNIAPSDSLPHPPLPHLDTTYAAAFYFIFTVTGVAQGSTVTSAKLALSANNGWGLTGRTYVAVENNLDPLGTGAIVAGTVGSAPYPRLMRAASAVTRLGARCGPTHSGDLATTGVPVRDASAYVFKAFGDNRNITSGTSDNLTDEFGPALQALVNDPDWNGTSQDVLVWMFPDEQSGTGSLGNLGGFTWTTGSGQTGNTTPSWGNAGGQIKMYESGSGTAPALVVGIDVEPINASVTTTAPSVAVTTPAETRATAHATTTVSYHNGPALATKDITSSGARTADIHIPQGTAPAGGWPLLLWIHGGFFTSGSRVTCPPGLVTAGLARGYAVASVDYRLAEIIAEGFEFLADGNEASFPLGIHDVKAFIRYLRLDQEGANAFNVNVQDIVLSGFSAGGHIAQFVAYSKGDTTTYEGTDSNTWNTRPAHVGRSNDIDHYYFDFNQNGLAGIDDFTVKGLFVFAAATSLQRGVNATYTPNADARTGISNGRRVYVSRTFLTSGIEASTYGELDVDKYLAPAAGTPTLTDPYLGKSPVVPDFPIGYAHGTGDILVTKAAGYTPLEDGLIANGYISTAPTPGVTSATGLSLYEFSGIGHDAMESHPAALATFEQWLDETQGSTAVDASVTVTAPSVALATDAVTVTVTASRAVTTTAPSVTAAITGPVVTVNASRSTTTSAPSAALALPAPAVDIVESRAVTTTAPTVVVVTPSAATSVSEDSTVTVTAPALEVSTGASYVGSFTDASVTVTAPSLALATGSALVSAFTDAAVTTTAPALAITAGSALVSAFTDAAVTLVAPALVTSSPVPTISVVEDASVTTTAPALAWLPGTPSVSLAAAGEAVTSAPPVMAAVGDALVSIVSDGAVTLTAPLVGLLTGTITTGLAADASTTTTAPIAAVGVGTSSVDIVEGGGSSPLPAFLSVLVPSPTITTTSSASVTTEAPSVQVVAPAPAVSYGRIRVHAARLLPARWTARLKETEHARL